MAKPAGIKGKVKKESESSVQTEMVWMEGQWISGQKEFGSGRQEAWRKSSVREEDVKRITGWDGSRWLKCLKDRESPGLIKNAFYSRLSRRMCKIPDSKSLGQSGGTRWMGKMIHLPNTVTVEFLFVFDEFEFLHLVTWHTIVNLSFLYFLQSSQRILSRSTLKHTAMRLTFPRWQ